MLEEEKNNEASSLQYSLEEVDFKSTVRELKSECDAFEGLSDNVTVGVQTGQNFDLKAVKIKKHVPSTK